MLYFIEIGKVDRRQVHCWDVKFSKGKALVMIGHYLYPKIVYIWNGHQYV
jgi:hypothetical protein